ncbi:MAG TPA: hypothetical protein VG759_10425 [Candidatus Angelobacter sp.]|jgi:hypothetical protein|nr:hypothetical protein [Candidatus Angelobacter sp.]
MILVGRGEDQPFFQIWKDGRVELMDDPLGHPIATFEAGDLELLKFLASHIEHYSLEPEAQDAPLIPENLKAAVKFHNGNGNGHKKPAGKTGDKETRNTSAGELAGSNVGTDGSNGQPTLSQAWLNR